jgi:hypothetical protein
MDGTVCLIGFDEWACRLVAKYGHLEIVQYLHTNVSPHTNGCPLVRREASYWAAVSGHSHIMHLHSYGFPWDREAFIVAAANCHLEIVKYLHTNGCPWSEEACREAIRHKSVMEYLQMNEYDTRRQRFGR